MAESPWLFLHQKDLILLFALTIAACTSFFLYVRARLADRNENTPFDPAEHSSRLARLDQKERFYQSLHFITLALFILLGVLILIHLSNHLNNRMQT